MECIANGRRGKNNPCKCGKCEKARRAARARKERDACLASLGLVKVRGCVSGKTYWE